jgi:pimeloyl-ACP methyl ester carboxylesterase
MFAAQIAALKADYRCVAWDHRGQGRSAASPLLAIDMDALTQDALSIMDRLHIPAAHFVGLSMGGFVGMRLAARFPERVKSLVLLETAAGPEPRKNLPKYRVLGFLARHFGVQRTVDAVMPVMFGNTFLTDARFATPRAEWRARLAATRDDIWRALGGVLQRPGIEHELGNIRCPTLVVVGDEDKATPPEKAEQIVARIGGARLELVAGAGHTSTVEQPEQVTALLAEFLRQQSQ